MFCKIYIFGTSSGPKNRPFQLKCTLSYHTRTRRKVTDFTRYNVHYHIRRETVGAFCYTFEDAAAILSRCIYRFKRTEACAHLGGKVPECRKVYALPCSIVHIISVCFWHCFCKLLFVRCGTVRYRVFLDKHVGRQSRCMELSGTIAISTIVTMITMIVAAPTRQKTLVFTLPSLVELHRR